VIDGGFPSYPIETTGQWVELQSDGANWEVVGAKSGGALSVPFTSLPDGVVDVDYSIKLTATGGWPGYSWSVKSGVLPQGLSMTPDGVISGIPTASATSSFVIQLTDSVGSVITIPLSITAVPPPSGSDIFLVNRGVLAQTLTSDVSPLFGGVTQTGNFLAAHIGCNGSGPIATTAPGWVINGGSAGGPAIAYKMNCGADETPPIFTGGSATNMFAYLEEWSGVVLTSALDKSISADGSGGPSWLDAERYDIIAKAPAGTRISNPDTLWIIPPDDPVRTRLQTLLAERFHLAVHRETKETTIFALMQDKAGAKLQPWKEGDLPGPSMRLEYTKLTCRKYSMEQFATVILSRRLGTTVVDKTGIAGEYNFIMTFQPDSPAGTAPDAATGPTFLQALHDQLGLKLERQKEQSRSSSLTMPRSQTRTSNPRPISG